MITRLRSCKKSIIANKKESRRETMSNKHFATLLNQQIKLFVSTFQEDSNTFFKNDDEQLIHPGEYGMYREQCFRNLLQIILPGKYTLSDGFIITSYRDQISTQCDIIIKNAFSTQLTDGGLGKFHPIEDVYGIVEIKSNLTKSELKKALQKLAEIKKMGNCRSNKPVYQKTHFLNHDYIPTFLVCNKLVFDNLEQLNFEDIYNGIDRKYWHNAILSLEDGLFMYRLYTNNFPPKTKTHYKASGFNVNNGICEYQYSQHVFSFPDGAETYICPSHFIPAMPNNKYSHIIMFLSALTQATNEMIKYEFDSIEYLGLSSQSLIDRQ